MGGYLLASSLHISGALAMVAADTLSYSQLFHEVKIAFPFVDTLFNGWLTITIPDTAFRTVTIPAVFYNARRSASKKCSGYQQIQWC